MGYFVKNTVIATGSTAVTLPSGSSAERPDSPVAGQLRFNTDISWVEVFDGVSFEALAKESQIGVDLTLDKFTGDGITTVFGPMSNTVASADQVLVFIGSIYQDPTSSYTVDGSYDITFTSAPPDGMPINIVHYVGTGI